MNKSKKYLLLHVEALNQVDTELRAANKAGDREAIAMWSERLTTLLQCIDFQGLEAAVGEALKDEEVA